MYQAYMRLHVNALVAIDVSSVVLSIYMQLQRRLRKHERSRKRDTSYELYPAFTYHRQITVPMLVRPAGRSPASRSIDIETCLR